MPEEIKIVKTSYSALDTFKQCPLKYKYQQIDKIRAPKSKEAVFGGVVHKVLEFFHSKQPASPTLDELLNHLKEKWPEKDQENPFLDEQEDMLYFGEAIKTIKNYYSEFQKTKIKPIVLDTETFFEVVLENPKNKNEKCLLRGVIDRIDKKQESVELIDYKTSKRFPSQQDVDNSLQLSLYALGLMDRWPQFVEKGIEKAKFTFYYLKHQESISTTRTKKQLDSIKEQVWDTLNEIEKSGFDARPSALCDWCGYKKICPMWRHLYKEQISIDDEQIKKTVDEYFKLKEQNSENNKRIDELKDMIEGYLNKEKLERVFGDVGYITRSSQVRYKYDEEKVKEILKPTGKWESVLSLDQTKLKDVIETLPYPERKKIEKMKKIDKEYSMLKVNKKKTEKS